MKRYALQLIPSRTDVDTALLRTEVNRLLLRSPRPMAFRLGEVGMGEGGTLLVEIATDSSREELLPPLRPLERVMPARIHQIGWGWPITAAREKSGERRQAPGLLPNDPYAASSHAVPDRTYAPGRLQIVGRIASVALSLAMILGFGGMLIVACTDKEQLAGRESLVTLFWSVAWFLWAFLGVPSTSFHRSGYVSRITCDPQGIEVRVWFGRKPRRLTWQEIWGLDIRVGECLLRSERPALGLPMTVFSPQDRSTLVKSILDRSDLLFVGSVFPLLYRRFDAPS